MSFLHAPLFIIKKHRRAFIALNLGFYGLFSLSLIATWLMPDLQTYIEEGGNQLYWQAGIFKVITDPYADPSLVQAMAISFCVNLGVALFLTTLPSLVLPFIGIVPTLVRGILWGIMFAPIGPYRATFIPSSVTLLIEGQAYVLAAFAAYIQGKTFLRISQYRLNSRWVAYKAGLTSVARLYVLVTLALVIAALYEGFSIAFLMPLFF